MLGRKALLAKRTDFRGNFTLQTEHALSTNRLQGPVDNGTTQNPSQARLSADVSRSTQILSLSPLELLLVTAIA